MTDSLSFKKAQAAQNIIMAVLFLFSIGVVFFISTIIGIATIEGYESSGILTTDEMTETAIKFKAAFNLFDKIILIIAIILIIGIAITSYKLAANPVFYVITFISAAFYAFIAYFFSYMFIQIVSNSVFTTILTRFPMTILLLTNLHWFALALIVVGAITLYGKKPEGQFLA